MLDLALDSASERARGAMLSREVTATAEAAEAAATREVMMLENCMFAVVRNFGIFVGRISKDCVSL